jgi:soluble lytic murein transglycosylase-like protein
MSSRLSAFVVPSERFTLRFDPTRAGLPDEERVRMPARRAVIGAVTSVAVVALAILAGVAQATPSAPAAPRAAAADTPTAAPADVAAAADAPVVGPTDARADAALYANAAATCPGLPASVLAAIHQVETRSAARGEVSSAGARGPMQFLPTTWSRYGFDANGDGRADIEDLVDAVYSAASYLCANGGAEADGLRSALWNYNHSWAYVEQVLAVSAS